MDNMQFLQWAEMNKLDNFATPIADFVQAITTSVNRATFYDTREETEAAIEEVHQRIFNFDRGLYTALVCLRGVNDYHRRIAILRLLKNHRCEEGATLISRKQERFLIYELLGSLTIPRALKLIGQLKTDRVNNAYTRKMICKYVAENISPFRAVKYKRKFRDALLHATGLNKKKKLIEILEGKHHPGTREWDMFVKWTGLTLEAVKPDTREVMAFVLGSTNATNPQLRAYLDAPTDAILLSELPVEVAMGIASTHHPEFKFAEIASITEAKTSDIQKMRTQRASKKDDGTEVAFNVENVSLQHLLVHILERRHDDQADDWLAAAHYKAHEIAASTPFLPDKLTIVIDTSASMAGDKNRAWNDAAVAIGTAMILASGTRMDGCRTIETRAGFTHGIPVFEGATDLASAYMKAVTTYSDKRPVFIITDGYENSPAGMLNDVMVALENIDQLPPTYQIATNFAAKTGSTRKLSGLMEAVIPLSKPSDIGTAMMLPSLISDTTNALFKLLTKNQESFASNLITPGGIK